MENFRKYVIEEEIENYIKSEQKLTEKDLRKFIKELYSQNKLVLTEEQLDEALPRWMKKAGQYAGMGAALAGVGGPATAQADTAGLGSRAKEKMAQMIDKAQEKGQQVIDKLPAAVDRTSGAEAEAEAEDLSTLVGQGVQDAGDGAFTVTIEVPFRGNISGAQQLGQVKAKKEISNHIAKTGLEGGEIANSYNFQTTGMQLTGDTLIVQVTGMPAS